MAQAEIQQERTKIPVEEMTEEQFLKNLYMFMKKRDTPIERIPNLGFKQIDLFVMFKVVKDLGGYHQVTSQQLWKQVYNVLGGNPRSTSAATCTRRHYEKLLLPYECHLTGIMVKVLPRNQPKHFHYANYSKERDDGQRPPKRKLISMPLHQNLQSDLHDTIFPLTPYYAQQFHPSHAVLPPHVHIPSSVLTPYSPPVPKPWLSFPPSHLNPTDRAKEPLEQLRYLAEQYKNTSGLIEPRLIEPRLTEHELTEPLNLSVDASRRETDSIPASSFSPPSSSKSPKFLNKPSPLYTPHHQQAVRYDACETQDGEAGFGDTSYSPPVKASEAYVIDISSSPTYDSAPTLGTDEGATTTPQKPSSPKTETQSIRAKEEREGSPEVRELNFSHILPGLSPRENGGKMEIEIPLSVFRNWLQQCGSSAAMFGGKQLPTLPPREDSDSLPTDLTFHMNPQHQSSAEDLRLTRKNLPSPIPTTQATGNHHSACQNPFTAYKPLPSGGILKSAASQDNPFNINKSFISKPHYFWDAYGKEIQASPIPVNIDSIPRTVQQDIAASSSDNKDTVPGGKAGSDAGPSAVLMLNSSSASLLQLTTEEVMKLKKIISSAS